MKVGLSYWMFEGGLEGQKPVIDAINEATKLGYDSIELCVASSGVLTDTTSQAECEDISNAIAQQKEKLNALRKETEVHAKKYEAEIEQIQQAPDTIGSQLVLLEELLAYAKSINV